MPRASFLMAAALTALPIAPAVAQPFASGFVAMSDTQLAQVSGVPLRQFAVAPATTGYAGLDDDLTLARSTVGTQMDQWWFEDGGELLADSMLSQMSVTPFLFR